MPLTQTDVENVSFAISKKGYDVDEVDVFLEQVANDIAEYVDTINDLKAQLGDKEVAEKQAGPTHVSEDSFDDYEDLDDKDLNALLAEKDELIEQLQRDLDNKTANDSAISQALIVAQRSADEIIAKANTKADVTIQDAHDEADRIVNRAETEKENIMAAIAKLEEEREGSRNGYADMLRDFIEDANTKLNNLGYDDDVQAIPYDDIQTSGVDYEQPSVDFGSDDLGQTAYAEPMHVVEKDMSGFGDLADEDDDLD